MNMNLINDMIVPVPNRQKKCKLQHQQQQQPTASYLHDNFDGFIIHVFMVAHFSN